MTKFSPFPTDEGVLNHQWSHGASRPFARVAFVRAFVALSFASSFLAFARPSHSCDSFAIRCLDLPVPFDAASTSIQWLSSRVPEFEVSFLAKVYDPAAATRAGVSLIPSVLKSGHYFKLSAFRARCLPVSSRPFRLALLMTQQVSTARTYSPTHLFDQHLTNCGHLFDQHLTNCGSAFMYVSRAMTRVQQI